jgi:hypothetical protein
VSDVGLSAFEEAHVQHAADEAFRVLAGDDPDPCPIRAQAVDTLRRVTIERDHEACSPPRRSIYKIFKPPS